MFKHIHQVLYQGSMIWKLALSSAISWQLAKLAGSTHPYLTPLSVILCMQVTVEKSVSYGLKRIVGTIAGVLIANLFIPYLGMSAWSLGFLILISTAIIYLMGMDKIFINQVALSNLLVLAFESHSSYGWDRIRDTFIGCAVAIIIDILLFPPNFTKQAIQGFEKYLGELITYLNEVSQILAHGFPTSSDQMIKQRLTFLSEELSQTRIEFKKAEKSIKFHPFVRKARLSLSFYNRQFDHLNEVYAHLITITETLVDWSQSGLLTKNDQQNWAEKLMHITDYLSDWKKVLESQTEKVGLTDKEMSSFNLEKLIPSNFLRNNRSSYEFALYQDKHQLLQNLEKNEIITSSAQKK